jgi:redox-sensing transcriptional repressor
MCESLIEIYFSINEFASEKAMRKSSTPELTAVPAPTLRRLPRYLHTLQVLRQRGREVVSANHIADDLKLDATQVRKDLAYTGLAGRPKVGHSIPELIDAIETFLGWRNTDDAVLVGAGSLGTALLGHRRIEECGLRIVAAFDKDPAKVGTSIHGKDVFPMAKLVPLVRRMHILVGVITVPSEAAQETANLLIDGGVRAIWNFTPTRVAGPENGLVVDADLYSSLGVLKHGMARALARTE